MVNMNIVRNIRHNFYTFCDQTSLHGWQYMRSNHSDQSSACCRLFRIVFWLEFQTKVPEDHAKFYNHR